MVEVVEVEDRGTRKNPKRKNPTDAFLRGFLLRYSTGPGCRRRARIQFDGRVRDMQYA